MTAANCTYTNGFRPHDRSAWDVVVAGGGIAGVAAALTMSSKGCRTAIIEPTGVLGREIVRARHICIPLSRYAEKSRSIKEFYDCLVQRKGWFDGMIDPNVAALAFDDLMRKYGVQVLFNVWPSRLLHKERKVQGLEVASKRGYVQMETSRVVDASLYGKIGAAWFPAHAADKAASLLRLTFNGIAGDCPDQAKLLLPEIGEVHVQCRATYWQGERQVALMLERHISRAEWMVRLADILPALNEEIPVLKSGVLAHIADDVWNVPCTRITAATRDERLAGELEGLAGERIPVKQRMLGDPSMIDGLYMAGPWIEGFPFDLHMEENVIYNAFRLGEIVGTSMLS